MQREAGPGCHRNRRSPRRCESPSHDPGFRSGGVTYDYDGTLGLPPAALRVLNHENFFERRWAPTIAKIINRYFDVIICHFTYYTTPLREAALKFQGLLIARAF